MEKAAREEGKSEEEKKEEPPEDPLRDTVLDLCDIMLMQNSPKAKEEKKKRYEMGGYSNAEFAPLVELASHLVRSMHTLTIDPESETFTRFRDSYEMKEATKLSEKIVIAEDTWWEYFTRPAFLEFVLGKGYATQEYGKALAHLCYGDKKLSKQICELVCRDIVSNYMNIRYYLNVMNELLVISDKDSKTGESLKRRRLEWIFGFSYLNSTFNDSGIKIGLESADQKITAPIYTYRSMATYDSDAKKSILQLLYTHEAENKRQSEAV